jgi:hypothetical protein
MIQRKITTEKPIIQSKISGGTATDIGEGLI